MLERLSTPIWASRWELTSCIYWAERSDSAYFRSSLWVAFSWGRAAWSHAHALHMHILEMGRFRDPKFGPESTHGLELLSTRVPKRDSDHYWQVVWFDVLIGILLNFLIFAGPIAIGAIFSIGAIAQYIAFILPIAIRVIFVRENFRAGPWNLGRLSCPIGIIALGWVALIVPILCFPKVKGSDLTPQLMNWTCLVYGGPMVLALIWYAIDARKWFRGPKVFISLLGSWQKVNVRHLMFNQPIIIDTKPAENSSTNSPANYRINEKEKEAISVPPGEMPTAR